MLPQIALKALNLSKISQSSFLPISTSCIHQKFNHNEPFNPYTNQDSSKPQRQLKKWRESFIGKEPIIPINSDNSYFKMCKTQVEFTPWGLNKHFKKRLVEKQLEMQRYVPERHEILGADLALAYFVLYIGGKVKFKDNDQWISFNNDKSSVDLPQQFDPKYVVSEIDVSDCVLYYEGLENFINCPRISWASFARSKEIDDWCVDRIVSLFPFIKYLDLSDCPKVSERGLEALYKSGMLQTVIVTNHHKTAAFELTCMMLEDTIPGLKVDIREPKEKVKPIINDF